MDNKELQKKLKAYQEELLGQKEIFTRKQQQQEKQYQEELKRLKSDYDRKNGDLESERKAIIEAKEEYMIKLQKLQEEKEIVKAQ